MKKLTILFLFAICFGIINVQAQYIPNKKIIKRTSPIIKTKINKTKLKTISVPQRVNLRQFEKMKPRQIANLRAATVDREAVLRLRYNKSWEITPTKFSDKDMKVIEYFGKYKRNQRYISVYPENTYYPHLDSGRPGFLPEMRYLILRFNPEMGKRYRIVIKLKPQDYRHKKVMTNVTGRFNDIWYINYQFNEIMFDFIASSNEIKISPIIAGHESYYVLYEPLYIEKIKLDKIED